MSKTTELFKVGQPKASAYIGMASPGVPLEVTALQIPDGCQIQFDRVEWFEGLTKETFDCGVGDVWSTERGRMRYSLCDCVPFLDGQVQRLYIDTPGHYIAVIVPEDGCLGMIEAYVREAPEMAGLLDDRLRGCCGLPQADLQAIKTTPLPRYKVGEQFSYSIRLINAGPSNASGAEVRDLLPEELELSGAITLAYGNGAMGPATLTREQLASFEVTSFPPTGYVDVTITGSFSEHGAYLNRVCIQPPEDVEDPNQGNNCSQVLINIDELQPKLEVQKTASNIDPLTGTTGVFTIVASNNGEDPDTNVVLTDALPSEFTYTTPFSVTSTGGATGVPASLTPVQLAAGVVIATAMPPGSTVTVTIPYAIPAGAAGKPVRNRVLVKGALSEDSDDVIVTPRAPRADLVAEKLASDANPVEGEVLTYSVLFSNLGPDPANGAKITDTHSDPASCGLTNATVEALAYTGGATGPATVTFAQLGAGAAMGLFPVGATVTATYSGIVQAGAAGNTFTNVAGIVPPSGVVDPNQSNNTSLVVVTPIAPSVDLAIVKGVDEEAPSVGDTITYTLSVVNNGPQAADGATITDAVPAGLTTSTDAAATYSGGAAGPATLTMATLAAGFVVPTLPAGGQVVLTYTATVDGGQEGLTKINQAKVLPPNGVVESNPLNNIDTAQVQVQGECYLKCDDELILFKDSGIVSGAGVCIGVGWVGYVEGRAVWQARDDTFLLGNGSTGGGGPTSAYLQDTYTNPWPEPALLRVDVQTQANAVAAPAPGGTPMLGKHVTIIHNIGETLGVSPPNFGATGGPIPTNWAWSTIETSNPSVHWDDSTLAYGYKPLTQVSNSMFYERVLQPGESVTLYSQFWATFYAEGVYEYAVHGGMRPTAKLYRNAGAMA